MAEILLIANAATTMFMAGVIWYVQIVHYPLFARVGQDGFVAYEDSHSRLTTYVVAPPMLAELATSILLVFARPASSPPALLWIGLLLVAVIWASTALLQVPKHTKLGSGFDVSAHRYLVLSNWIRTAAWSTRSLLVIVLLHIAIVG